MVSVEVVALDDHRGETDGVTWRVLDVRNPLLAERLAGVDVVVHVDIDMSVDADRGASRNVQGTQTVVTAAAAAGVGRVVLLSSAMVYGANADNLVPLPEDSPLRATAEIGLLADLLEIERLGARAPRSHPGITVTMVRPAIIVGAGADVTPPVTSRHPGWVLRGSRPRWQFCHVDDLVSALGCAALGQVTGGHGRQRRWLEQDDLERISGMHRIELPASVAFGAAERLHRLGILPAPATETYVVHPWCQPVGSGRPAGGQFTTTRTGCGRCSPKSPAARRCFPTGGSPRCHAGCGGRSRGGGRVRGYRGTGTTSAAPAARLTMANVPIAEVPGRAEAVIRLPRCETPRCPSTKWYGPYPTTPPAAAWSSSAPCATGTAVEP